MTKDKRVTIMHNVNSDSPRVFIDKKVVCNRCGHEEDVSKGYGYNRPITSSSALRLERAIRYHVSGAYIYSDGLAVLASLD